MTFPLCDGNSIDIAQRIIQAEDRERWEHREQGFITCWGFAEAMYPICELTMSQPIKRARLVPHVHGDEHEVQD